MFCVHVTNVVSNELNSCLTSIKIKVKWFMFTFERAESFKKKKKFNMNFFFFCFNALYIFYERTRRQRQQLASLKHCIVMMRLMQNKKKNFVWVYARCCQNCYSFKKKFEYINSKKNRTNDNSNRDRMQSKCKKKLIKYCQSKRIWRRLHSLIDDLALFHQYLLNKRKKYDGIRCHTFYNEKWLIRLY